MLLIICRHWLPFIDLAASASLSLTSEASEGFQFQDLLHTFRFTVLTWWTHRLHSSSAFSQSVGLASLSESTGVFHGG